jgi:hypothetical protein
MGMPAWGGMLGIAPAGSPAWCVAGICAAATPKEVTTEAAARERRNVVRFMIRYPSVFSVELRRTGYAMPS